MKPTSILIQDLNGTWEQVGVGTMRGLHPANVELSSDGRGPKQATFDLLRETWVNWPDIQAFAPVQVWVAGKLVWAGRIVEAPIVDDQRSISVRAEGWQTHLDDDQYFRKYIHTDLTQWFDARSKLDCPLNYFLANGMVDIGNGSIKLTVGPINVAIANTTHVGAVVDMGEGGAVKEVSLRLHKGPGSPSGAYLYARCANSMSELVTNFENASFSNTQVSTIPTTSTLYEDTFAGDRRYFCVFLYVPTGYTPTNDDSIIIESCSVTSSTSYWDSATNHSSTLTGADVVLDALDQAAPLVNADRTRIDTTQAAADFYLPEFAPDGPRTPGEIIDAVNPFYDYLVKVDEERRVHFRPRPTVPAVRMGRWGASTFNDASAASAEGINNKVVVSGSGPAGDPVQATRTAAMASTLGQLADPAFPNPNFASGTTGWITDGTVITQITLVTAQDADGYGGRWDLTGASDNLLPDLGAGGAHGLGTYFTGGKFKAGVTYVAEWRAYAVNGPVTLNVQFGSGVLPMQVVPITAGSWNTYRVFWTPKVDTTAANTLLYFGPTVNPAPAGYVAFDAFKLYAPQVTMADRRFFSKAHRLDTSFMLTTASANRLGDLFLLAHRDSPFKGQGSVTGHTGLRDYLTGDPVGPEELLRLTGELVHFDDKINPDTGAVGRSGRLVSATYRPATDTATFDIDNTRTDFDSLLARVGVKVSQIR